MTFCKKLYALLSTDEVRLEKHTIFVKQKAVGILLPNVFLHDSKNELIIYAPDGKFIVKEYSNVNLLWEALVNSRCVLFGTENQALQVESFLENAIMCKTTSFLATISNNCAELINAINQVTSSRIGIIGLGGIGSILACTLAGLGVKNLTLIDGDLVEASNLNRQILYTIKDIGKTKCSVLKSALHKRFDGLNIQCIESFLDEKNAKEIISAFDLIINSADYPISIESIILSQTHSKIDTILCGYINRFSSIRFIPKYQKSQNDNNNYEFIFPEPFIVPSIAPINLEIAGIVSMIALLSITKLRSISGFNSIWDTTNFQRFRSL